VASCIVESVFSAYSVNQILCIKMMDLLIVIYCIILIIIFFVITLMITQYTLHKTSLRYFRVLERFIHQDALDYLDERLFVFLHSSFDLLFTACFTFLLCTN